MSSSYRFEAMASASVVPAFGGHIGTTPVQGLAVRAGMGSAVIAATPKSTRTDAPPGPLG